MLDNVDLAAADTKVSFAGPWTRTRLLRSLLDASAGDISSCARAIRRDNTELELLEGLVALDASNDDRLAAWNGHEAIKGLLKRLKGWSCFDDGFWEARLFPRAPAAKKVSNGGSCQYPERTVL